MRTLRQFPLLRNEQSTSPLDSTSTPREHQRCEGQLLTTFAPQPPWVSTDLNLLLISEGSIDYWSAMQVFSPLNYKEKINWPRQYF